MNLEQRKATWKKIWPTLNKHYKRDKTFLDHRNIWELLIAVILSAQTTDDMVNKVTPHLFAAYPKPIDLASAPIGKIEKLVGRLGFFRSKAKHIKATAQIVVKNFKGNVPDNEKDLRILPGVGRKTAMVVLSNGFGKDLGIPVDTHVIRFSHRYNLSSAKGADGIERDLLQIIPQKLWRRSSYAIKEYGRKEGRARPWKPEEDPVWKVFKQ